MKHINVALFVPDEGCPHRCSFCNQKTISGKTHRLSVGEIDEAVKIALSSMECNEGEIAFFGGSFTGIDHEYMIELLERAKLYVDKGLFKGIRISTRPDYINEEILDILAKFGVTSIEIGCQSLVDSVLELNSRGHTSDDIFRSASLIKEHGFELGVQMMTGLYGDDDEGALYTAEKLISLKPDTARIYPTVVLEETELCKLFIEGKYLPQSLDSAVSLCSKLLLMFHENNIKVIRLGLHSGGNVEDGFVAGVYHPAFRELCEGEIYLSRIMDEIKNNDVPKGKIEVVVGKRFVSMAIGQNKRNITSLNEKGYDVKIIQDENYSKYKVSVRLTK